LIHAVQWASGASNDAGVLRVQQVLVPGGLAFEIKRDPAPANAPTAPHSRRKSNFQFDTWLTVDRQKAAARPGYPSWLKNALQTQQRH